MCFYSFFFERGEVERPEEPSAGIGQGFGKQHPQPEDSGNIALIGSFSRPFTFEGMFCFGGNPHHRRLLVIEDHFVTDVGQARQDPGAEDAAALESGGLEAARFDKGLVSGDQDRGKTGSGRLHLDERDLLRGLDVNNQTNGLCYGNLERILFSGDPFGTGGSRGAASEPGEDRAE